MNRQPPDEAPVGMVVEAMNRQPPNEAGTSAALESITRHLPDEAATWALAAELYRALTGGALIFLHGDLGAGKTTLVRGLLRAAGHAGPVKSPTFTLVEEYTVDLGPLYHFDLYRLGDPEELEWLGIRDYLRPEAVVCIEWPERGEGFLPLPDLVIRLTGAGGAREVGITAHTEQGRGILNAVELSRSW